MEYIDYETGEPITRERYIERGLERGQLVWDEPCGCVVIEDRTAGIYLVYCNKHEAAPDMYEALKEITELAPRDKLKLPYAIKVVEIADKALAKAEGKETA